jgi:hypothetical protein
MSDQIGNILVCVKLRLIVFFCYVCYHVNIFYVSGTILGLTFLDSDTIVNFLLRFIRRSETPTKLVVGCC